MGKNKFQPIDNQKTNVDVVENCEFKSWEERCELFKSKFKKEAEPLAFFKNILSAMMWIIIIMLWFLVLWCIVAVIVYFVDGFWKLNSLNKSIGFAFSRIGGLIFLSVVAIYIHEVKRRMRNVKDMNLLMSITSCLIAVVSLTVTFFPIVLKTLATF